MVWLMVPDFKPFISSWEKWGVIAMGTVCVFFLLGLIGLWLVTDYFLFVYKEIPRGELDLFVCTILFW